jgi:pimeloyl-ACP methyl ester carboxylesterase
MRTRAHGLLTIVVAVAVAACSSPSGTPQVTMPLTDSTAADGTSPATTESGVPSIAALAWAPCDDPLATDPALECATLDVPLDYDDAAAEQIGIAMVRIPADSDTERQGAVLFNPGGPGGSGFDDIAQGGATLVAELGLQAFDLIGFDPRGVDRSNGITCLTDEQQDAIVYLDPSPDTPEEEAALDDSTELFETSCVAKYGDTLRHYSTDNTARDMDAIRAALGDETISYLGISYGTYLGATYATLFPERVRAMVLDSAFEPVGDTLEQAYTTQLVGFEQAFHNWADWCESEPTCAFTSDDVEREWDALHAELDGQPVAAADGRLANQAVLEVATISALYSDTQWPVLAKGLQSVGNGDPTTLFRLADSYVGRDEDGTFSTLKQSGKIIRCSSGLSAELPDDPAAFAATLQELAPRFASDVSADDFTDNCAPLMPDVTPRPLQYSGDAAIVVTGGQNDPATPFRWAEEMTVAMGDTARLVTFTGEGHGMVLASSCVTAIEAAVLVDLQLPDADTDTVCDPDPDVPEPAWWSTLPVPTGVGDVVDATELGAFLGLTPTMAYSEIRTASVAPSDVLDNYDVALEEAGFTVAGRQQPVAGIDQAVYFSEDGELFTVLVMGPDSYSSPELEGLDQIVDATTTLVVLLHIPD